MAKEKVTVTLDAKNLAALRSLVGPRSLSASIDRAIATEVARRQHLVAVDEWLDELEAEHGPIPTQTLDWAGRLVDDWAKRKGDRKAS